MGKNEEDWMEVERGGGTMEGGGKIMSEEAIFLSSCSYFPSIGQRLEVRAIDSFLSPHLDFAADTF